MLKSKSHPKSGSSKPTMTKSRVIIFATILALFAAAGLYLTIGPGALEKADIRIGECRLTVEIADTPRLREKGLSNRKHLKAGHGMLFVFDFQRRVNFWMKDTQIPLSIAFISSEGTILQIEHMEPMDLRQVKSDYSARYALEVNQGFFKENGITVGMRVDVTNVTNR